MNLLDTCLLALLVLMAALRTPSVEASRLPRGLFGGVGRLSNAKNRNRKQRRSITLLQKIRGGDILYPSSMDELDAILADSTSRLVVIDFWSNNCPPCEKVAPLYQELSEDIDAFPADKVIFLKINVEDQPMITQKYGVTGWPTFVFIKNGEVQTEIVGGKLAEATLYDWVKLLMPKETTTTTNDDYDDPGATATEE